MNGLRITNFAKKKNMYLLAQVLSPLELLHKLSFLLNAPRVFLGKARPLLI